MKTRSSDLCLIPEHPIRFRNGGLATGQAGSYRHGTNLQRERLVVANPPRLLYRKPRSHMAGQDKRPAEMGEPCSQRAPFLDKGRTTHSLLAATSISACLSLMDASGNIAIFDIAISSNIQEG
ncbi:hypothetical protein RRG08_005450 [Elysia crispata]|uniref:Uncharacterized protein n=1 Tax=Elysia crispata TaxID=231223 RepID=A0AAE0Y0U7_9GAST|nr:hypothetical protein RRG08_005450 [Elysia crispata]